MSNKERVIEAVTQMPEEATWDEIMEQLDMLSQERVDSLKALLREGMQGKATEMNDADWDKMHAARNLERFLDRRFDA